MAAIWLPATITVGSAARLRDVARTAVFPELTPRAELYQERLNALAARALPHGIRVYLYLCEPLNLPVEDPFWRKHPDVRGALHEASSMDGAKGVYGFCTGTPQVKEFLRTASANASISPKCPLSTSGIGTS